MFRTTRHDAELDDELRAHVQMRMERSVAEGMAPEDARRDAMLRFGNLGLMREDTRGADIVPWLDSFVQDVRYGLRSLLRRNPSFTAVAVLALALGIGANTAVFSVVNAVLLRPLAYHDPDRIVTLLEHGDGPVAVGNYVDWRDQSKSYEAMAAADYWTPNLAGIEPPEHIWALRITANMLPMLGVQPLLGRVFTPEEDQVGHEHEVVLSYRLWQRRFGADRNVLGSEILLNGEKYAVIGVMPASFRFAPFWATKAELWAPDAFTPDRLHSRGGQSLRVFARLKPGVTVAQAQAEIKTITARLDQQYPSTQGEIWVTPLRDKVVGDVRPALLVLLGAVGFVMLIACANVTHMLLARAAARQKEIALRAALGAKRARVIRQLLTESLLLAGMGGMAGLALAWAGTRAFVAMGPADIPRLDSISVDWSVLLFGLMVALLTGVLFGLAPAMQASVINITDALKEGIRGSSGEARGRGRLRGVLVASEVALALVLLVGAGLMVRTFAALRAIDPGWNPHNVLSMVVSLPGTPEMDAARRPIFYRELLAKAAALPGVQSAGAINHLPLAGDIWGWSFVFESDPNAAPDKTPDGVYRIAMPGYFQTMQIPFVRGRDIALSDDANAPGVVVVNQAFVRKYFPNEDPIGKRLSFDLPPKPPVWLSIIGVVKDSKQNEWDKTAQPETYRAALQTRDFMADAGSHMAYITLVVRTTGDPAAMAPTVQNMVWSLDRKLAISEVFTMDQVVKDATAETQFELLLMSSFAVVALLLAAVGIYGVMNYSVSRRIREIGIRMSLGATRTDVLGLVVRQGMTMAIIGGAAGAGGAFLLARFMSKMLYGVHPADPLTFACVGGLLGLVALVAIWIPARRAATIDPMVALRYE